MSGVTQPDEYWMASALKLAEKGRCTTTPNPNVGCVIIKNSELVGEGYHRKAGSPHAEIHALKAAGENAKGATAYVSLEPCSHFGRTPPCADALIEAGITRVVCAMLDPNPQVAGKGVDKLKAAGIQTRHGVLESEAEKLNLGFLKRMRTGLPHVVLKMASSLDGATAMASGESQWITGAEARSDVQVWRSESCAVVTGVETVIQDNPSLNVRLAVGDERQPDRIVLDTTARIPLTSQIATLPGKTFVVHSDQLPPEKIDQLSSAGFEPVALAVDETGRIKLDAFIKWATKQQYNQLWVEAGATLAGSFLEQQLVDEVVLYQAPKFLGANTRPVLSSQFTALAQSIEFSVKDMRMIGNDVRWRLQPIHP